MRSHSANEAEEKMSFPLCASKEDNEVEEDDKNFFTVFEGKNEKSFCKRLNEAKDEKL